MQRWAWVQVSFAPFGLQVISKRHNLVLLIQDVLLVRYQHDDLPSGRSVSGGSSAIECYRCNGFGHFARDCPTSAGIRRSALPRGGGPIRGTLAQSSKEQAYTTTLECYLCNKVGHFARDCVRGRGGPEERSLRCLKCHRRGHFAKDCRDEESRCFRCYKSGHIAKDCEEPDLCYYCNKVEHLVDILQLISPFLNMLILFFTYLSFSERSHVSRLSRWRPEDLLQMWWQRPHCPRLPQPCQFEERGEGLRS